MTRAAGIIFSDLDGTYVDATGHPALSREDFARVLEQWRVVWVSSRTADELLHWQHVIGHDGDAIGEDGGVVIARDRAVAAVLGPAAPLEGAWLVERASPRAVTAALVRAAFAEQGIVATTMEDLGTLELSQRAGAAAGAAERALRRRTSVLLADLDGDDLRVRRALRALRDEGCAVARGGRWVSVVQGADKGTTAQAWLTAWHAYHPGEAVTVVAIGNAENDESLLRSAHIAFVARNADGSYAGPLANISHAQLLDRAGIAGWAEMCEHLNALVGRAS